MNIVFISNFYNHHQSFISRKLYELTDGNYRFIATTEIPEERKKLGYREHVESFVCNYGNEGKSQGSIQKWIDEADVVIVGSAPEALLANRKRGKKLIFRYAEHPSKKEFRLMRFLLRILNCQRKNPSKVPIYMLCASAYTASDYAKMGLFKGKTYKWGYFPECKRYDNIDALIIPKKPREILWCGRFLDWKHPDDVLTVAKRLKNENIEFHVNIIGAGEMADTLKQFVLKNDLSEQVSLWGSMFPEKVRGHMERAGIYLFTSDRKEGWGAVLNEAMNSGCAVVASSDAGATPYLIRHNENGMCYRSGDVEALYQNVKYLLDHPEEQLRMGRAAYKTIVEEWNADVAAERLIALANRILEGDKCPDLFSDGPCSYAPYKSICLLHKTKEK